VFHSIRWRIAIPYAILIILLMIGVNLYFTRFFRDLYLQDTEMHLVSQARLIREALSPYLAENASPESLDSLASHWAELVDSRVTFIAADGTVSGESHDDRTQMDNHLDRPEIQQALTAEQGLSTRFSRSVGYQMMYLAVPIREDGQVTSFVRVALPLQQIEADLQGLQRTLLGVTVVATALAVLLATLIAQSTSRPIRQLTKAAAQISSGDLQGRLIPASPDEVGQLTQAFNVMAVQLRSQIEALETERSKIALVLQEMTDGVLIADNQGHVQLINPAAENMFEVKRDEAMGRSLAEILRHHQLVELWRKCQETEEQQSTTVELGTRRFYLQCVTTPLSHVLPGSVLLVFQNLTRVRHLETVRRDFISNISHELRTPLASLKALTDTLQDGALEDPPAARRFLQRMETEVDALVHMVSELLELSRIESGRVPLQFKSTDPADILYPAVERLRLQAERADIDLSVEVTGDLPPVLADPTRLEQVMVNLLHNAIKFTPPEGKITVQARRQDGEVIFCVRDTGVGIPAADLPRIFERFYKADRARSSGGTGLGLAIARHMVEAHGGRIWAESVEGKGSSFYFSIPIAI
jgi:two-component system phosphate regulon sensor histidine kinase PhoR